MKTHERFFVSREQAIDAAPIACILILLCFSGVIAPTVPLAMLHVWLWLRHPRTATRYFIAFGVFALYFLLEAGPPLLKYCVDYFSYGDAAFTQEERARMFMPIAIGAATGIVPILYRLLSRCSLASVHDINAATTKPHGTILDILFLSLFCGITFVTLGWHTHAFAFPRGSEVVVVAVGISAGAVLSMRLMARAQGVALGVNFVLAWGVSALIAFGFYTAERAWHWMRIQWRMGDDLYELEMLRYGLWDESVSNALAFTLLLVMLPVFALVNRRCGVILAKHHQPTRTTSETERFAGVYLWIGRLGVAITMAVICLVPVALPSEAWTAGWPLNYVYLDSVPSNTLGQATEFDTLYFSISALLADIACVATITLAFIPPLWMVSRWRGLRLTLVRAVVLVAFTSLMAYTFVMRPQVPQPIVEQLSDRSSLETYVGSPVPALLEILESEVDWIPETNRLQVETLDVEGLNRELTETALSLPRLREVRLYRCDVSQAALEQLRGSMFLKRLSLIECRVDFPIGPIVEGLPRLEELHASTSELPWTDLAKLCAGARLDTLTLESKQSGRLRTPESVRFLTLLVPSASDQEIEFAENTNLETIYLRNFGYEFSSGVTRLTFPRMPKLRIIELDNRQKVELSIADAPLLTTVNDRFETRMPGDSRRTYERLARLQKLSLGKTPYLKLLHVDLSEGEVDSANSDAPMNPRAVLTDLLINGRRDPRFGNVGRMAARDMTQMIRNLAHACDATGVTIRGVKVDSGLIQEVGNAWSAQRLAFVDCDIEDDAFDETILLKNLFVLDAETYAPSDAQLQSLVDRLPRVETIRIDGSKLTRLPPSVQPGGRITFEDATQGQEATQADLP